MKNSTPLTDEERDKFAKNVGLLKWAIRRLSKTIREVVGYERLYDEAVNVLLNVVRRHDPARARLSYMFWFWFVRRAVNLQVRTSQETPVRQLASEMDVPAPVDDMAEAAREAAELVDTLTPDEQALVYARYRDGRGPEDIARDYGVSDVTIRAWLGRIIDALRVRFVEGKIVKPAIPPEIIDTLPPDEQVLIRARYQDGRELTEIGKDYGVSRKVIARRINKIMEKTREKLNPTPT